MNRPEGDALSSVRLSIAVATCGRPESLARCLDALAAQSRAPDEIIVVDQDPLQETKDAIRSSGLTVRYFEQPKLGLSASRNLALSKASGTILAVTDDDCLPEAGWAAAIVEAFDSERSPTALTGPILAPSGARPPGMCAISLRKSLVTEVFSSRTIPWYVGSGGNFSGDVGKLQRIGGWDERLGAGAPGMAAEDCDMIDRLLSAGEQVRYDAGAVVRHAWQTRERRLSTRLSYGYGIGALCGLRLAARDAFALRMLVSYARMHVRKLLEEVARANWSAARERIYALASVVPGCMRGLWVAHLQPRTTVRHTRTSGLP